MATVDEDLSQLEKDIRQLKIEYDQYFGGGRSRPPSEIEWRIELLVKRYAERGAELSFGQRFRYNNLTQTYAKYKEVFRKRMRKKEEGIVERHFGAAARAIEAERMQKQSAQPPGGRQAPAIFAVACMDPDRETDKIEKLYEAFRGAKQNAGESTDRLTLASFREFVRQKTHQLQSGKGCSEVEYVVAVDGGQVRLKARAKPSSKSL